MTRTSSCARSRTPSRAFGQALPGLDLDRAQYDPARARPRLVRRRDRLRGHGGQGPARRGSSRCDAGTLLALATRARGAPGQRRARAVRRTHHRLDRRRTARSYKKLFVHRGVSPLICVPQATMSTEARAQPAAGIRAARGRDLQRLALGAAHRRAHPEPRVAARRHRGPAAPELPGGGDAGDRLAHRARCERAGFAAVVSGAGPSILVLCSDPGAAPRGGRPRGEPPSHAVAAPAPGRRLQRCYSDNASGRNLGHIG